MNKFFILLANFDELKAPLKEIALFPQEKFYRLEMLLKDETHEM